MKHVEITTDKGKEYIEYYNEGDKFYVLDPKDTTKKRYFIFEENKAHFDEEGIAGTIKRMLGKFTRNRKLGRTNKLSGGRRTRNTRRVRKTRNTRRTGKKQNKSRKHH
jgi:hypothetical protein